MTDRELEARVQLLLHAIGDWEGQTRNDIEAVYRYWEALDALVWDIRELALLLKRGTP